MTEIFTEDSVETAMLLNISKSLSFVYIIYMDNCALSEYEVSISWLMFLFQGKSLDDFAAFLVDLVHFLSLAYCT